MISVTWKIKDYTRIILGTISNFSRQAFAVAEKELSLNLRFKFVLVKKNLVPIISFLMPLIIMGFVLNTRDSVGYWNQSNYLAFLILSYCVSLLHPIIVEIPQDFLTEKYWGSLPALLIAPIHRFTLLFGMLLSKILFILVPFTLLFVTNLVLNPISFSTLVVVLIVFTAIVITFLGFAAILCPFSIGNESIFSFLTLGLTFVVWFSALNYPLEIFPVFFQEIIKLNPMYYYFDLLRLIWYENNIAFTFTNHGFHFLVLLSSCVLSPIIGVKAFNIFFNKLEIQG